MDKTTKKLIALLLVSIIIFTVCGTLLSSCNKSLIDTHYHFKYAVIQRYDGEQLIEIKSWTDFKDGDQIQITSVDDITYLLHSSQVILLSDKEG